MPASADLSGPHPKIVSERAWIGWPVSPPHHCYAPTSELIGKIHLPETCANLCFGGKKKNRLFMCGSTSIYAVYVEAVGALVP